MNYDKVDEMLALMTLKLILLMSVLFSDNADDVQKIST
jgi:hypothetical protein